MRHTRIIVAGLVAVFAAGCGARQERQDSREGLGGGGNPDQVRDTTSYADSLGSVHRDSSGTDTSRPGPDKY